MGAARNEMLNGFSTDPLTLTQWVLVQQQKEAPHARGNLSILLNAICVACKFVDSAVRRAGLSDLLGLAGTGNIQGEDQKKLDIVANEVFINVLRRSGQCSVLVSEEIDDEIIIEGGGEYSVVFDPLDGSSNIDCGVSIGTIYGIYKKEKTEAPSVSNVLKRGRELVGAGYCLYGSSCSMVLSVGKQPAHFTLDPSLGEFVLTSAHMRVPEAGRIYSINEGNSSLWADAISRYVQECKSPSNGKLPMSLRYVGSMVADVHRTLLYGGIFMYPADRKATQGKLRLLYEAC
ncbi:hypothetical protein CVIRNUC_005741 [Coccomyxa viridis]|uniref:fructose-bisphosphatase n=1 Tax=Coccomyxa viridis TaxID=1274662 RepID=A0AAV1I6P2_9CHLO|nr:hypothetical protein CVIRNUC_005741 [Coccomyxa viridis]